MNKTVNKIYTEAKAFNDSRQAEIYANEARIIELKEQLDKLRTDSDNAVQLKDLSLFRKNRQSKEDLKAEIEFLEERNRIASEIKCVEACPDEWTAIYTEHDALVAEKMREIQKLCRQIVKVIDDTDPDVELMNKAIEETGRFIKTGTYVAAPLRFAKLSNDGAIGYFYDRCREMIERK